MMILWNRNNLHAMGRCKWKSFKDVLEVDMLKMDEVGADTAKHRKNVIADKIADWARIFQVTLLEGDGKINIHVTHFALPYVATNFDLPAWRTRFGCMLFINLTL
jgi:hypothetical protein